MPQPGYEERRSWHVSISTRHHHLVTKPDNARKILAARFKDLIWQEHDNVEELSYSMLIAATIGDASAIIASPFF